MLPQHKTDVAFLPLIDHSPAHHDTTKGSCQVKKNKKKYEKKSDGSDLPPPPPPYRFFFLIMYNNKKQHNKYKISNKYIRVGASPTHPLPSFYRIFGFVST